jgi:hypothetical protein
MAETASPVSLITLRNTKFTLAIQVGYAGDLESLV